MLPTRYSLCRWDALYGDLASLHTFLGNTSNTLPTRNEPAANRCSVIRVALPNAVYRSQNYRIFLWRN